MNAAFPEASQYDMKKLNPRGGFDYFSNGFVIVTQYCRHNGHFYGDDFCGIKCNGRRGLVGYSLITARDVMHRLLF